MPDNSIDFVVTDPPYRLHFMGKGWDGKTPSVDYWKEVFRICKPGSMLAAFGGSRTHHHLMLAIEQAGWEIRDVIMWVYGSGFPKSHNFGRKLGREWEGFGTALKPAYEPIIIAMKPLNGTFAQNAEEWGVGGINIDGCRIEGKPRTTHADGNHIKANSQNIFTGLKDMHQKEAPTGRWPANIIFDEEAAQELDQMSGVSTSPPIGSMGGGSNNHSIYGNFSGKIHENGYGDSGGASRFFYCAKASSSERNRGLEGMLLKTVPDGRTTPIDNAYQRGETLRKNTHPTVKPISLMKYIITLLAPPHKPMNEKHPLYPMPEPILLDPFAGSGSTLIAAKELGISAIGIEKEQEYYNIACQRIQNWPVPEK